MKANAGDTVLLRQGPVLRWVRIVHAGTMRADGQLVTVQNCDQYGRAKPQKVLLDGTRNTIEWLS